MPDAAWSTIFLIIIVGINFMGVRIYGELEYWFALIKIVIVIVFIIIGTVLFSRSGKNKQNKKLMLSFSFSFSHSYYCWCHWWKDHWFHVSLSLLSLQSFMHH